MNSLGSSREAGQRSSPVAEAALPSPSTACQTLGCSLSRFITIYYFTDQSGDKSGLLLVLPCVLMVVIEAVSVQV